MGGLASMLGDRRHQGIQFGNGRRPIAQVTSLRVWAFFNMLDLTAGGMLRAAKTTAEFWRMPAKLAEFDNSVNFTGWFDEYPGRWPGRSSRLAKILARPEPSPSLERLYRLGHPDVGA